MNTILSDYYWADRLTPLNYYGYPSSTDDRIEEIDMTKADNQTIQRIHDFKQKCMDMLVDVSMEGKDPMWEKDIWDNKIVIECKHETGDIIYIGFYDFKFSIGKKVSIRSWCKPYPYKQAFSSDELSALGHA